MQNLSVCTRLGRQTRCNVAEGYDHKPRFTKLRFRGKSYETNVLQVYRQLHKYTDKINETSITRKQRFGVHTYLLMKLCGIIFNILLLDIQNETGRKNIICRIFSDLCLKFTAKHHTVNKYFVSH